MTDESTRISPDDTTVIAPPADDTVISPGVKNVEEVVEPASGSRRRRGPCVSRGTLLSVAAGIAIAAVAYFGYISLTDSSGIPQQQQHEPERTAQALARTVSEAPKPLSETEVADIARHDAKGCPRAIDDGLTMTACAFAGNTLKYTFDCSGPYFDFISENSGHWATLMTDQLLDSPRGRRLAATATRNGLGISLSYRDPGGRSLSLSFAPSLNQFKP